MSKQRGKSKILLAPQTPRAGSNFCHPSDVAELNRRQLVKTGISLTGYLTASQLFGSRALAQSSSFTPSRRLVWIQMNGGWDILEITDPKPASTANIDMVYDWALAAQINPNNSNLRIGRWLTRLAARGEDLVAVRGLAMGTNSHTAGRVYMDTGVLSNSGDVNAASIPAIVAAHSQATIPIIQLNGGSEPLIDRGISALSVVRAQNLALYQSMYPASSEELEQKLRILDHLKNSIDRVEGIVGGHDRLTALRETENKIRGQFQDDVGSKLSLSDADLAPFTANAPTNLNNGARDAFALTLKLLKNNLVTCINMGLGGFDTHSNQEARMQPIVESFDYLMAVLIDELKAEGALDNTLIVVFSDFGRTPRVNNANGRDHWPVGGALMVGGGIEGGRIVGATNDDLQAESVDTSSGEIASSGGVQLNPTHLGGSVLELILGSSFMEYRSYLESIPALTRLKS